MGSRRTRRSGPGRARVGLVPIIAVLGSVVIPVFGSPAGAHLCAVTSIIRPGETAAVPISVTVERNAVADVEITFPAGLRLERFVARRPGWTATRSGAVVRVRGPEIPAYSCAYFSATVTPLRRDVYRITMVQRDRSGAVVARSTPGLPDPANPFGAQRVYAGVDPPSPPSEGADPVVIAGITLIAVALLAAGGRAAFTVRSRRREARDAELDDRIGAFLSEPADPPVAPPPPGDGAPPSR